MITRRFQTIYLFAILGFFLGSQVNAFAQTAYFNEWLSSQNQYVKLLVPSDGLYRVTASDLLGGGLHTNSPITSANLQVFYRGVEIPIYVKDSISGGFEYLEFYGYKNDGAIDSLLYRSSDPPFENKPALQPNLFSSFFTDTSAYFVTWDAVGSQRLQPLATQNFQTFSPEPWYRYRVLQEYDESFFVGGGDGNDYWHVLNPDWLISKENC